MVQYKLYYFDIPGLAEPIRILFHYAGQKFEDIRIKREDFPAQKSKFPYGQVPVLEVDGKQLAQSGAILKYLAKKFGLAGKDDWEEAKAAEMVDFQKDFGQELRPYFAIKMGFVQGDLEKVRKEVLMPALEKNLPVYEKLLAASGSGFMLPSGISYVDIIFGHQMNAMKGMEPELMKKHPKLVEYSDRVLGQPQLKEYMAKRKV